MSKNTVNLSRLDIVVHYLKEKGYKPKITMLDRVNGRGKNDFTSLSKVGKVYFIRKLEYLDKAVLEKFIGTNNLDTDDYIFSYEFQKEKVPIKWVTKMYK